MNKLLLLVATPVVAILLVLTCSSQSFSQEIIVNPIVPSNGLVQKEQLWNLLVVNPSAQPRSCFITLNIIDKTNGQSVLSAITNRITLATGPRQLKVNDLVPITYNSAGADINMNGADFLPPGNYQICFSLSDGKQVAGTSCINSVVSVLAPPQLIFPENKAIIKELNPSFSWTPPVPGSIMKNGQFEYKVVKVNEGQLSAAAINDNIPVYTSAIPASTFLNYPGFAPHLEVNQLYAWQVTVRGTSALIKSDVWTFTIGDSSKATLPVLDTLSYAKMSGNGDVTGYVFSKEYLKFEFINPGLDSIFQVHINDITNGQQKPIELDESFQPRFAPGKNLVTLHLKDIARFRHKHLYQLDIIDKTNYVWRLLFQYQ